jgi:hypothetical protein
LACKPNRAASVCGLICISEMPGLEDPGVDDPVEDDPVLVDDPVEDDPVEDDPVEDDPEGVVESVPGGKTARMRNSGEELDCDAVLLEPVLLEPVLLAAEPCCSNDCRSA